MNTSTTINFSRLRVFSTGHCEASLNWLALGLLLAAWNVADNGSEPSVRRKPESLRGYSCVSVRAAQRCAGID